MAALVLDKEVHWLFCAEVCLLPSLLPLCPEFLSSVASLTLHFLSTGLLVQNIYCFMQILGSPVSMPQKGRNTGKASIESRNPDSIPGLQPSGQTAIWLYLLMQGPGNARQKVGHLRGHPLWPRSLYIWLGRLHHCSPRLVLQTQGKAFIKMELDHPFPFP